MDFCETERRNGLVKVREWCQMEWLQWLNGSITVG